MIEGISAITLGTHDMQRAVQFYRSLGFDISYGGEVSSFTSFRAGTGYLNLIAQPDQRAGPGGGASFSTSPTSMHFTTVRWRRGASPRPRPAMPNGGNATFISPTPMGTSSASRGLCGLRHSPLADAAG